MKPILIVDDDLPTQQLLTALMRRNGFSSVVAANGAEAIDVLATTDFGVIILDLMMPAVDGQAVIDFVSRERENVPVIVCTAAGPRRTDAIVSKVVRAVVRKPFDIDQLTTIVASLAT
jgi:two-component system, OmpR family, response regulator VanR